jgi:hypothetical protein
MIAGRAEVIEQLVEQLLANHPGDRPRRIAVDGITAAGKTTWARDLTATQTRTTSLPWPITCCGHLDPAATSASA